jgi:hypothetical protein
MSCFSRAAWASGRARAKNDEGPFDPKANVRPLGGQHWQMREARAQDGSKAIVGSCVEEGALGGDLT